VKPNWEVWIERSDGQWVTVKDENGNEHFVDQKRAATVLNAKIGPGVVQGVLIERRPMMVVRGPAKKAASLKEGV